MCVDIYMQNAIIKLENVFINLLLIPSKFRLEKEDKMKKILIFISTIAFILSNIFTSVYAQEDESILCWKSTLDEYGNIVYVLDMSDKEIEKYEISQLKKEYEHQTIQRTSGYTYEYKRISTVYDTGSSATSKILIGKYLSWGQRGKITTGGEVTFTLKGSYKSISGEASIKLSVQEEYPVDNNYDSCLGLFARLQTSKYLITKKDKYSGTVISTTYQNVMTSISTSIRPIVNKSKNTIEYKYGGKWYTAKMIKSGVSSPITSSSVLVTAITDVFN